jgi:pyrimidine-nucleoside phosphorylase
VESVEVLRGGGPEDVVRLTVELTAEMLLLAGVAPALEPARARVRQAIADGSGLRKLEEIVAAQHGDPASLRDLSRLPTAQQSAELKADRSGVVQGIQCEQVGLAGVELGAGRKTVEDRLDLAVGFTLLKKVGEPVKAGEALVHVHHNGQASVPAVLERLRQAYRVGDEAPPARPLIVARLG